MFCHSLVPQWLAKTGQHPYQPAECAVVTAKRRAVPDLPRGAAKPTVVAERSAQPTKRPKCLSAGEIWAVLSEILKVVRQAPLPRGMAARKSAFGSFLSRLTKGTARHGMSGKTKIRSNPNKQALTEWKKTNLQRPEHCSGLAFL